MARTKSNEPIRSERLLMILANGGPVTLKEIEDTMNYRYMNRIGCEIYCLKIHGGVIKSHKQGRKVVAYELVNPQEMIDKMLTPKGFSVTPIVGRDVSALADLNAKPAKAVKAPKAPVIEDEVTEITE